MWRGALFTVLWLCGAVSAQAQNLRAQQALMDSLINLRPTAGHERMRFSATTIDAGVMGEDDAPRSYTFSWCNEGPEPLVVTRVQTTCGCARAEFDRRPVPSDGEGRIEVVYNPKGRPGSFLRKIFVYTQLSATQPTAVLELRGEVTPSLRPTHNYPCVMGALALKHCEVRLDCEVRSVERIECMNMGDEPLSIAADSRLLPPSLKVWCDKTRILPSECADIVVEYDPGLVDGHLSQVVPVILTGVDTPPSGRTIRIVFEENK